MAVAPLSFRRELGVRLGTVRRAESGVRGYVDISSILYNVLLEPAS